jgi:hypothetical protein
MQVGSDSVAGAFDAGSRAVSAQDRLRNLVELIRRAERLAPLMRRGRIRQV